MLRNNQLSLIILLIIIGTTLYMLSGRTSNKAVKNIGEMELDAEAEAESESDVVENTEEDDEEEMATNQEESNLMFNEINNAEQISQEEETVGEEEQEEEQRTKSRNALDTYFQNSGENDLNTNTFGPNDFGSNGADLSTAYKNPLPKDSCTDCIDFSKNKQRKYNSKDYLPQDINEEWFETDFSNAKYQVEDDKLILKISELKQKIDKRITKYQIKEE